MLASVVNEYRTFFTKNSACPKFLLNGCHGSWHLVKAYQDGQFGHVTGKFSNFWNQSGWFLQAFFNLRWVLSTPLRSRNQTMVDAAEAQDFPGTKEGESGGLSREVVSMQRVFGWSIILGKAALSMESTNANLLRQLQREIKAAWNADRSCFLTRTMHLRTRRLWIFVTVVLNCLTIRRFFWFDFVGLLFLPQHETICVENSSSHMMMSYLLWRTIFRAKNKHSLKLEFRC